MLFLVKVLMINIKDVVKEVEMHVFASSRELAYLTAKQSAIRDYNDFKVTAVNAKEISE